MKHILLILSLLVIGCTPKGGPEQMLRMKDGREIPCRLLSVRANGLVVDTSQPPVHHITNAEIGMYSFESIEVFINDRISGSKTIALFTFAGAVSGGITGYIIGKSVETEDDVGAAAVLSFAFGILGTIPGLVIGEIINSSGYDEYNPAIPNEREQIAKHAIFKDEEPDELKKIK